MTGRRFLSWVAVSSRPQMDGGSPTDQRERNKAHIEKWGGVLVADLEVPGQSRSYIEYEEAKRQIEAYRQLDALIKANAFDVLICYNVGRLGRKRSLITTLIDLCYEAGIMVYRTSSPPHSLEFTRKGYSDLLVEGIEGASFQNEIDQFREHHRTGMIRRAERGLLPGNVPYGWRKVYDKEGKYHFEVDEMAAGAIRKAFDWFLAGEGKEAIAIRLNREGFYTYGRTSKNQSARQRKPFTNGAVRSIFSRVFVYAGYVEVNRTSKKGRTFTREKSSLLPPIIDEATLQRVLAEMTVRKRSNPPKGQHLYSGIVLCTRCNVRMSVVQRGGERKLKDGTIWNRPVVRCAQPEACHRSVSFAQVERAILAWFDAIENQELPPDQPDLDIGAIEQERQALQKQIDALPHAQERAFNAFVDGDVDKSTYQAQTKRLEARKRELQDKIQAVDLKLSQQAHSEARKRRWNSVREVGRAMIEMGKTDPAKVNAWLREHIRVEFDENRKLAVLLS